MTLSDTNKEKQTLQEIRGVVASLEDKKAENIQVLDVSEHSSITDYLILATGTSNPHLKAMKAELDHFLKDSKIELLGQERDLGSGWVVVDAFDYMIHLQTEEVRDLYRLEQLWKDSKPVDLTS